MQNGTQTQREGFALAAAVMALVMVGALVTGGFYAASQEGRISTSTMHARDALNVAEHGLNKVIGTWTSAQLQNIAIGTSDVVVDTLTVNGRPVGVATVEVRRLSTWHYFMTSTGEILTDSRYGGAKRTVSRFTRTRNFGMNSDRAVQVLGGIEVGGNSRVVGYDSVPSTWADTADCPPPGGDEVGVVAKDTSKVSTSGNGSIVGSPPKDQDATMDSTSFEDFGDVDYDDLADRASKIIPDGSTINNTKPKLTGNGLCDTSDPRNWGAPHDSTHACHYYFPIIHAEGDLTLNSTSAGQGILLVDGDLHIAGGYEFNGIIIVKGRLTTGSGNARIKGTTLVKSDGSEVGVTSDSDLKGTPIINFSSCAVDRAVRYSDFARAYPIGDRSWFDLSAVGVGT